MFSGLASPHGLCIYMCSERVEYLGCLKKCLRSYDSQK